MDFNDSLEFNSGTVKTTINDEKKHTTCNFSHDDDNIDCAICFEQFTKNTSIHILECEHTFHSECLYDWYSKPGANYTCPLCNVQREVVKILEPENIIIEKAEKKCQNSLHNQDVKRTKIKRELCTKKYGCIIF